MAIYTMTLKDALESGGGTFDIVDGETVVTRPEVIGLAHYPEHRAGYRERLNGLIFDRYMNREIGMETVSMFAQAVRRRMNEQMPVMNKLYESVELEYDALSTVDLTTTNEASSLSESDSVGTSTADSGTESGTRVVNQDFPQHALAGNADYASSGADTRAFSTADAVNENTGSANEASESTSTSHTKGYQGNASQLVMAYRESLLNVDQMVLDSLADCFMGVWDTPAPYTDGSTFHAYYS